MTVEEKRQKWRETKKHYLDTHPDKRKQMNETNKTYWAEHAEEINRKRREKYAATKANNKT